MATIEIGGVKVQYTSFPELGKAVEETLLSVDARLKKTVEELRKLKKQQRALKVFLGGKKEKPVVSEPSGSQILHK